MNDLPNNTSSIANDWSQLFDELHRCPSLFCLYFEECLFYLPFSTGVLKLNPRQESSSTEEGVQLEPLNQSLDKVKPKT